MQKEDFVRILIQTLIKIADDMSNDIPSNVAIMGAAKRLYWENYNSIKDSYAWNDLLPKT